MSAKIWKESLRVAQELSRARRNEFSGSGSSLFLSVHERSREIFRKKYTGVIFGCIMTIPSGSLEISVDELLLG